MVDIVLVFGYGKEKENGLQNFTILLTLYHFILVKLAKYY